VLLFPVVAGEILQYLHDKIAAIPAFLVYLELLLLLLKTGKWKVEVG
jgi:hypothetical protein